jgi:hypothetical protein
MTKNTDGRGRSPNSVNTRFKTGSSGNPKGRPKRSRNRNTAVADEADSLIVVNENGRRKKISKWEASVKQMVNKAVAGDLQAFKAVSELLLRANASEQKSDIHDAHPVNAEEAARIYREEIKNG